MTSDLLGSLTGAVPALDGALALDYSGSSAFAGGMTADDFSVQHEAHGEAFRYFEGVLLADGVAAGNRSGRSYREVEVRGKGLFYEAKDGIVNKDFGLLAVGSTSFSCLPSVCDVVKDGMVLRVAQSEIEWARLVRGSDDTDWLPQRFLDAVSVFVDGVEVDGSRFEVVVAGGVNDADRGGVRWVSGAPAVGSVYTVRYSYRPLYVCLGEYGLSEPLGVDGVRLPLRVVLRKVV